MKPKPKDTFDIFKVSSFGGSPKKVSGPHKWTVAWRKAAKLNDKAREAFKTGRIMYDVPEYVVEKHEKISRDFGSFALGAAVGAGALYGGQRLMERPKARAAVRLGRIKAKRAAKAGARGVSRRMTAWGERDPAAYRKRRDPPPKSGRRPMGGGGQFGETMYEANEVARFRKELAAAERGATQSEIDEWKEALAHEPDLVAERIDWLLAGHYGQGAYIEARKRIRMRGNAPAWLTQVIGALEWGVSFASTRRAWNNLTEAQKAKLARAVDAVITSHLREE